MRVNADITLTTIGHCPIISNKIWIDFMHKALQVDGIKEIERPFVEKRTRLPSHTIHVTARSTFGIFCISERIPRNFISNSQRREGGRALKISHWDSLQNGGRLSGQIFWVSLCQEMLQPIENITGEIIWDINENCLDDSKFQNFMRTKGCYQMVDRPTYETGSLLDHIYVNDAKII